MSMSLMIEPEGAQARWDGTLQKLGRAAPPPVGSESETDYLRRLARVGKKLIPRAEPVYGVTFRKDSSDTLPDAHVLRFAEMVREAVERNLTNVTGMKPGTFKQVLRVDEATGLKIREFHGPRPFTVHAAVQARRAHQRAHGAGAVRREGRVAGAMVTPAQIIVLPVPMAGGWLRRYTRLPTTPQPKTPPGWPLHRDRPMPADDRQRLLEAGRRTIAAERERKAWESTHETGGPPIGVSGALQGESEERRARWLSARVGGCGWSRRNRRGNPPHSAAKASRSSAGSIGSANS
jgi:hypothetical protein